MNRTQARLLIRQTFIEAFDKDRFLNFTLNLLNHIDDTKASAWNSQYVKDAFKDHVHRYERLGTYTSPGKETLDVLIVHLTKESKLERARTAIRNFVADHLKTRDEKDAALVAFVSPTERQWRFSYVKMEYATIEKDSGKVGVETRLTPARRFSYLVGEGESCHTAQTRFLSLLQDTETDPALAEIEEAFSVEAVTKEFFTKYTELFQEIYGELEKLVAKDKAIREEFKAKDVNTVDFAKKLMGQIVFLYFLQKKGWLGVAKGQDWGSGPRDFLRRLANGEYGKYNNFFNDILEPLFYDTLATDRGHEAWCNRFKCRIPFLNGGLFEPLAGYNWRETSILLPDTLFTNSKFFEEGITGTGVLDVFDRYNFTVNEAEPLEKEVAIDPEMLGKVFENLIEENRRKGLGAYYTPREIVHYMCQESLINYLDTAINTAHETIAAEKPKQGKLFSAPEPEQQLLKTTAYREIVRREDIETFVHLGEQYSFYEAAKQAGTIGRDYPKPPKSIEAHARLFDEKLAEITICDPAVGSGAFPVGMMHEIVRARCALTPYFNDVHERTPYHFKRHAIQNCLYGVDIDAGAVEIAKLRLWLSLVVDEEDVKQIKPLPNLDYKVVAGNSLRGVEKGQLENWKAIHRLETLKPLYFDEVDKKKKDTYRQEIDDLIHKLTDGKTIFDFEIYFSEVFHQRDGFDLVIGNPPYGMVTDDVQKSYFQGHFKAIEGRFDTFVLFIERAISLCRMRGLLNYIIPNPLLSNLYTRAIRRFILENCTVIEITNFGMDVFDDPTVHTCIVFFSKQRTPNPQVKIRKQICSVEELKDEYDYLIPQNHLGKNQHSTFDIFVDSRTDDLLARIAGRSIPLGELCYIRQCIKTGDDGKYVQTAESIPGSQWKRSLRGKSIERFFTKETNLYVKYGPWLARNWANKTFYEREKIGIRETGNRIIATLDEEHRFFLSSLYALYPRNSDERHSLKYLLAILNSNLATYFLNKIALELTKGAFTKFRTNQIARLPIRQINFSDGAERAEHDEVAGLVEHILAARKCDPGVNTTAWEREIDRLVYKLYDLTPDEIRLVEESVGR